MTPKSTPKDFFLHLAATVFLYTVVIALINLAFAVVDRMYPDVLQTFYNVSDLVWPISILIVLVPVTYVLEWLINRDIAKMPEKKDIWIRRWRIYLTLFLTGVTIVIDLITLINKYLNGEITTRFIEKVLIVLIVSAVVFAYYLLAKNNAPGRAHVQRIILMWVGIALALAAIIAGFVIVGSPANQRSLRFDGQRIDDLLRIQSEVVNYWQRTGELPKNLQTLNDPLQNFNVPTDPEIHASYEYEVGPTSFKLCATFDLPGSYNVPNIYPVYPGILNSDWNHPAGHACFYRTVDSRLYPAPKTQTVPKTP